jgi:3-phenylpropionate/trans-cinnamate dioxygenase ferredoxin reductase component
MSHSIAIVGAGHAAGQAIVSLRQQGHTGRIMLFGEEPYLPYQRPPLSKKFLAGELELERLYVKPAQFYVDKQVEVHLNTRVESIEPDAGCLRLASGESVGWDRLLLTLGSRVHRLPVPGADLAGVHYLRTIDDVRAIQPAFRPGQRLAVIGGGYIGLEVAAIARQVGLEVTVVEMADRLLARVVCPEVSAFYRSLHEQAGVRLMLNTPVQGFAGSAGHIQRVLTSTGELEVDLVIAGIGVRPVTELAEAAGLDCDDGICVDEYARTSHAFVYAAGDCTRHPNAILGRSLRLESVHNALEQARTAAASLCGEQRAYQQVPWFWSDQYDTKLQIVGMAGDYDRVVLRGDPASGSFSACYLKGDILRAVDAVNSPRDFMQSKALLAVPSRMDMTRLADPSVSLPEAVIAA